MNKMIFTTLKKLLPNNINKDDKTESFNDIIKDSIYNSATLKSIVLKNIKKIFKENNDYIKLNLNQNIGDNEIKTFINNKNEDFILSYIISNDTYILNIKFKFTIIFSDNTLNPNLLNLSCYYDINYFNENKEFYSEYQKNTKLTKSPYYSKFFEIIFTIVDDKNLLVDLYKKVGNYVLILDISNLYDFTIFFSENIFNKINKILNNKESKINISTLLNLLKNNFNIIDLYHYVNKHYLKD